MTKNSKIYLVQELLLTIFVFIYIFNPRFIRLDLRKVLDLISIVYLFIHGLIKKRITIKRTLNIPILFGGFFLAYLILLMLIHILIDSANSAVYMNSSFEIIRTLLRCVIASTFLIVMSKNLNFSFIKFVSIFEKVVFLQLIFVALAFVFPSVKSIFNGFTIKNSESEYIAFSTQYNPYRCFGLAENLFDAFGYVVSLLIVICFIDAIYQKSKLKLAFTIVLLIIPMLNARTGIILSGIGIILTTLYYYKSTSIDSVIKKVRIFSIIFIASIIAYYLLPNDTKEWIIDGLSSINGFIFENENSGVVSVLINQRFLPSDILFGEGASPEMLGLGHSDIGYIQCIWRYGLIGTIFLLAIYFSLIIQSYKNCIHDQIKCFAIATGSILLVYLFKMYPFTNMGGNLVIFGLSLWEIYEEKYGKTQSNNYNFNI